jgi:hypothetical protein
VIDSKLSEIPRVGGLQLPEGPGKAGNYLLIGSDARDFVESAGQQQAFGTSADSGPPKSDTLMVVHIDPDAKTSLLVSFPRDLLVDIPGRGRGQINAAFNDGPQKVIDTLKANFDIDINHYVEVNFIAFHRDRRTIGKIRSSSGAGATALLGTRHPDGRVCRSTGPTSSTSRQSLRYYGTRPAWQGAHGPPRPDHPPAELHPPPGRLPLGQGGFQPAHGVRDRRRDHPEAQDRQAVEQ